MQKLSGEDKRRLFSLDAEFTFDMQTGFSIVTGEGSSRTRYLLLLMI
eukprot:SAG31_NODE_2992_length_4809_cov_1.664544_2_plen_47_part_00